ncbi:MAG: N-acetylmuramoyl-L-alanine amidase [Phycisphaerales bacterium]|nr:N-acetylmuramoyl-L-alanine amidase [Phycisphaerales bacterium]
MKRSRRTVVVFSSLMGVLCLTSILLMTLAPAPLTPDQASNLFATDSGSQLDTIFDTKVSPKPGVWRYIYIHHSRTPAGNALTLGHNTGGLSDHFLIGNGSGCIDGEIQLSQRWNLQSPAAPPPGAKGIDPACISICLVGDFDHAVPTATQMRRLNQLVSTLQARFRIPAEQVTWVDQTNTPAAIGRYFPADAFRSQLMP